MVKQEKPETFTLEGAEILFRNFSGKPGTFNAEGDRNFCVILPEHVAAKMIEAGMNVRELKPREEGDAPKPYIQVKVKYRGRKGLVKPPRVVLITSSGRTNLGEDDVNVLDFADIRRVDLIINPYRGVINGREFTAAYLKTLFVTIEEDELERKYAATEDSARNVIPEDELPWA